MRRKTLVINKGTKYQEFYGHDPEFGWVTAGSPIHMLSPDATWEDVKREFPTYHFNGIDLVTIEITIVDESDE